ncbi:glycosyltransferase [Comamonas endophytica]|uniref:Glycosyltransferase n=2 Tax=Comamonas endophytica TaxID=2949090 RepID=A0ABY6G642_9BURK|nr:glycosyltransferase [Acidovorax sp. 5MLIR]MCD2511082.1 glycosyltransferase [Acidovorax sp. D4N7]UYG50486.1 glycosyltransferase [Acidovorax sp. 5MLIR]
MKSLVQLYQEHQGKVSDKWEIYLAEYDRIFSGFRSQPIRMLEIGIQNGGSLEIWTEYFRNARIFIGCDINPACSRLSYEDPRVKVVIGDANAEVTAAQILGHSPAFDLIIDDGSHVSSDIVKSFAFYFRHLEQGGVFVAEDLHCSYWQDFEGGLYHPYSSLAFFKRLVDVINHEHWGIDRERKELVRGFSEQYQTQFDEAQLAQIHSIEFFNSVCVVRKKTARANVLGDRIVAGRSDQVVPGLQALSGSSLAQPQSANPWTAMDRAPDEAWEQLAHTAAQRGSRIESLAQALAQKESQLSDLSREAGEKEGVIAGLRDCLAAQEKQARALQETVHALHRSRSWRITRPLRALGSLRKRLGSLLAIVRRLSRSQSLPSLARKAVRVWRREGLQGLRARIRQQKYLAAQPGPAAGPGFALAPAAIVRDRQGRYALDPVPSHYTYVEPQPPMDLAQRLEAMQSKPLFSIVVPVYNTPPELLEAVLDSVKKQWYPHWQLILSDDASPSEETRQALARIDHPQIKLLRLERNQGIAGATNAALDAAEGDFIVFMDHDDEITVDCLYELALCIEREQPDFIYSDEDKLTQAGDYSEPHFKPDWSPDTMMSTMFTCHVSCVRRSLLEKTGGLRSDYDGCQDWDFVLRVSEHTDRINHIAKVLYHWRIIPASIASDIAAKPYVLEASRRVREDALQRRGLRGDVEPVEQVPGYFRVAYHLQGNPLISIIIPTRDNEKILRRCIESLFERTRWRHFEVVILDNGSVEPHTCAYLQQLQDQPGVRVIRHDAPFNFSELNNIGVRHAQGELLLFLNDDTEILQEDWLERMGSFAQLPHVGAVGAKLLYPGGRQVQHAGILNLEDGPGHAFLLQDGDSPGYYMRNLLEYNWLAVTGACLMVARDRFEAVDGFDETLPIAYNDVDLCMRLHGAGFYNVVCQAVRLTHHESVSRGVDHIDQAKRERLKRELAHLYEKNPRFFLCDPFHNPNLHPNGIQFEVPQ